MPKKPKAETRVVKCHGYTLKFERRHKNRAFWLARLGPASVSVTVQVYDTGGGYYWAMVLGTPHGADSSDFNTAVSTTIAKTLANFKRMGRALGYEVTDG